MMGRSGMARGYLLSATRSAPSTVTPAGQGVPSKRMWPVGTGHTRDSFVWHGLFLVSRESGAQPRRSFQGNLKNRLPDL